MDKRLQDILENLPAEEAGADGIEAYLEKVMAEPGGVEALQDLARELTGGAAGEALAEDEAREERLKLQSPARLIFRIELMGTRPRIWRRVSLPADCAFYHLHHAIQDAFGWQGRHAHRFEIWEEGRCEVTFSPPDAEEAEDDYCEVENRVLDLFREQVGEFQYLYDFSDQWRHRVVVEELVGAGMAGTAEEPIPKLHDGEGHGPPEGCGGATGFTRFLQGDHPLCENYENEILETFRAGKPDLSKVTFRDVTKALPGESRSTGIAKTGPWE